MQERPEDGCNIWSRAGYFKVRLLHLSCLYDAFRSWALQSDRLLYLSCLYDAFRSWALQSGNYNSVGSERIYKGKENIGIIFVRLGRLV